MKSSSQTALYFPNLSHLDCDECGVFHDGNCPVHGSLPRLCRKHGYDQASLAYTKLPIPKQFTVKPSLIDGAGLGVFATLVINKGVELGYYEGRKILHKDIGKDYHSNYAWVVRKVAFYSVLTDVLEIIAY